MSFPHIAQALCCAMYFRGRNDEKCERSALRRHVRGVVGLKVRQFVPSDGVFWYFRRRMVRSDHY